MNREIIITQLKKHAENQPNKIAVKYLGKEITYKEFDEITDYIRDNILHHTKGENIVIPIRIENQLNALLCIYGVLKANSAWLPLAKEIPANKCLQILSQIDTPFVITDYDREIVEKSIVNFNDLMIKNNKTCDVQLNFIDENIFNVLYTSGTTGEPKGCVIEEGSMIDKLISLNEKFHFGQEDNYFFSTNYSFDVSITEIFGWVFAGGVVTVYDSTIQPAEIPQYIYDNNVTHVAFAPSFFKVFFNENTKHLFSGLRYIFLGGERLPLDLTKKLSSALSRVKIFNMYGPTETSIYATCFDIGDLKDEKSVPIGKPLDGVKILIDNDGNFDSDGGEILIGGVGLSKGYYKKEELTNEKFIYVGGERYYKSGDLGTYIENEIHYLGRIDNQIKINGIRVETEEIEGALKKILPINDAVVRMEEHEEKKFLVAYLIAESNDLDVEKYTEKLRENLESYYIPKIYICVDEIPLNKNKKIDHQALNREFLKHINTVEEKGMDYASMTEVEMKLLEIWSGILKTNVGLKDNFYFMGGDSLAAVELIFEVEEKFGVQLLIEDVTKHPTVEGMSGLIERKLDRTKEKEFKSYWSGFPSNEDIFNIEIDGSERNLVVESEKSKKLLLAHIESSSIPDYVVPDRILIDDQCRNVSINTPFTAVAYKSIGRFPLFSRQEFYLRKNFASYLVVDIEVNGDDYDKILGCIDNLIRSQLLFRVVISENEREFVEKDIPMSVRIDPVYFDFSGYRALECATKMKKVKEDILEELYGIESIHEKFLYEISVIKTTNRKFNVTFFVNHHIADASALGTLKRLFVQYYYNQQEDNETVGNTCDYKTFTQDVIANNTELTVQQLKESDYYLGVSEYIQHTKKGLRLNADAPLYEIVVENPFVDRQKRSNFLFDYIAKLIEDNFSLHKQCYKVFKKLQTYNGESYHNQIGDYHVGIFVPFDTKDEENLFDKSESLLNDVYVNNKWHIDYLCTADKYRDNNITSILHDVLLSINYLGEFTEKDLMEWRTSVRKLNFSLRRLDKKIRITCFNLGGKSYIYVNNASLGSDFDCFILG